MLSAIVAALSQRISSALGVSQGQLLIGAVFVEVILFFVLTMTKRRKQHGL